MTAHLYDPRLVPPEPDDWDYSPGYEAEHAYYEADDGYPCPVCKTPKPIHRLGCWMAPEGEPSYRLTPASFIDYDKDYRP